MSIYLSHYSAFRDSLNISMKTGSIMICNKVVYSVSIILPSMNYSKTYMSKKKKERRKERKKERRKEKAEAMSSILTIRTACYRRILSTGHHLMEQSFFVQ